MLLRIFWTVSLVLLIGLGFLYQGEQERFFGIADAAETKVSPEYDCEIIDLRVSAGQSVKGGDTLAVVIRPNLEFRLSETRRQLQSLTGEGIEKQASSQARIAEIRSDLHARVLGWQQEIRELQKQLKTNRELSQQLAELNPQQKSASVAELSEGDIPVRVKILNEKIRMARQNAQQQIQLLQSGARTQESSVEDMQNSLMQELEMLESQRNGQSLLAPKSGIVSAVYHSAGERIQAYDSLVSISSRNPHLVKGYIHESAYHKINAGDSVWISPAHRGFLEQRLKGVVHGVGSRIVEMPLRLRKIPEIMVWGREISVRIPEQNTQNQLLLGEKVKVEMMHGAY